MCGQVWTEPYRSSIVLYLEQHQQAEHAGQRLYLSAPLPVSRPSAQAGTAPTT